MQCQQEVYSFQVLGVPSRQNGTMYNTADCPDKRQVRTPEGLVLTSKCSM